MSVANFWEVALCRFEIVVVAFYSELLELPCFIRCHKAKRHIYFDAYSFLHFCNSLTYLFKLFGRRFPVSTYKAKTVGSSFLCLLCVFYDFFGGKQWILVNASIVEA